MRPETVPTRRQQRILFWIIVALGAALRIGFIFWVHPPDAYLFSDMKIYDTVAGWILAGTAGASGLSYVYPPGYPLLIALSRFSSGGLALVTVLHAALSVATLALAYRATSLWLGRSLGILCLLALAFDVHLIALTGYLMPETVFAFFLAALFYLVIRKRFPWKPGAALAIGFVFAAAGWFKGQNQFFAPIFAVWVASRTHRRGWAGARSALQSLCLFALGACVALGVQGVGYERILGRFILSPATTALNLVEGKCSAKSNVDSEGSWFLSPLFLETHETEEKHWDRPFSDSGFFLWAGIDCIKRDPFVLVTSLRYVYYLFFGNELWPVSEGWDQGLTGISRAYGVAYANLVVPGLLLGLVVMAKTPWSFRRIPALIVLSLLLCSWAFKSELRYRVPFDVVIVPIALLGWSFILKRVRLRRVAAVAPLPDSRRVPSMSLKP